MRLLAAIILTGALAAAVFADHRNDDKSDDKKGDKKGDTKKDDPSQIGKECHVGTIAAPQEIALSGTASLGSQELALGQVANVHEIIAAPKEERQPAAPSWDRRRTTAA